MDDIDAPDRVCFFRREPIALSRTLVGLFPTIEQVPVVLDAFIDEPDDTLLAMPDALFGGMLTSSDAETASS